MMVVFCLICVWLWNMLICCCWWCVLFCFLVVNVWKCVVGRCWLMVCLMWCLCCVLNICSVCWNSVVKCGLCVRFIRLIRYCKLCCKVWLIRFGVMVIIWCWLILLLVVCLFIWIFVNCRLIGVNVMLIWWCFMCVLKSGWVLWKFSCSNNRNFWVLYGYWIKLFGLGYWLVVFV